MRTPNQVAIYCTFREDGRSFYILVKRNEKRGGFWQSLTGGEEDFDGGDLIKTVIRETKEELGVDIKREYIIKIPYSFKFTDKEGAEHTEHCFGIILPLNIKNKIKLSEEHTAIIYSINIEYLKTLLKFEENKIGLEEFYKLTKGAGGDINNGNSKKN